MDVTNLLRAIDVLSRPQIHAVEMIEQAQEYCESFKRDNVLNLPQFFTLFSQCQELTQNQHKFWILGAIGDILFKAINKSLAGEVCEVDVLATGHSMLGMIQSQGEKVLTQLYLPQFAKIFVLAVKLDHLKSQDLSSRNWPQAFIDLLSLVQSTSDENVQKEFIRLIVKTLLVFDEEVVERSDSKPMAELDLSQKIKDGMRIESVPQILKLLQPVLQNYTVFQIKTIRGALKVISQLIDWNELSYFVEFIDYIKEFVKMANFRQGAFACLGAIVIKGMSESDKISVIKNLQFLETLNAVKMLVSQDMREDINLEEQEEEEKFLSSVSESILRLGKWCLQIYGNHEKLLPDQQNQLDYFVIFECLLQKALYLFDSDKPSIGRPIIELFTFWIQAHVKLAEITPEILIRMGLILQVLIKRIAFPKWCSLDIEPEEREEDYSQYRQEMTTLYINLCLIKVFHNQVLSEIHKLLQGLNPSLTPVQQAEVPLLLIFNLIQSISLIDREKPKPDNPYIFLVNMLTQIDFLSYDCHLITNCYLETMVRYAFYFSNNEDFFAFMIDRFFSPQAITSQQKCINNQATYQFLRLCELMQFKPAFVKHVDTIVTKTVQVIQFSEESSNEILGNDEVNQLYNVLGLQACNQNYIDEAKRFKILQWAVERLLKALANCPQDNVDKMSRIVFTIKTTTKGFKKELTGDFVPLFKVMIENLVPLIGRHMTHQMLVKQIIFFVQSNVTTLGLDILPIIQQLIKVCIDHFPFEKMEDILILTNFSVTQLKRQALLISSCSIKQLFIKASQIMVPTSNTSDAEKTLINLNTLFIRLIVTSMEEIGINVLLNQDNVQVIEPLIDWLSSQFYYSCEQSDKKSILRIFRYLFMGLQAIGPNSKIAIYAQLADIFLNKRSKEQWALTYMHTPEEQHCLGLLSAENHNIFITKIVDLIARSASQFHIQEKQTLDSNQAGRIIVEMLALIYHAGFQDLLQHFFTQMYGLDAQQTSSFFTLFNSLLEKKKAIDQIQIYYTVLLKSMPTMCQPAIQTLTATSSPEIN